MSTNLDCPCGSGNTLEACCGPYHAGSPAPTAEAMMRSRYSAFVLGKGQYLSDTLSEDQRADFDVDDFNAHADQTKWLGLEIRQTENGGTEDTTGTVEFVARYRENNETVMHHERAQFNKTDGNWLFTDCQMNPKPPQRTVEKVGRNDPCPCGSGKKYKKCCGKN